MAVFIAAEEAHRLDKFVVRVCPGLSRTQAQALINAGQVTVNGQPARASLKLDVGDRVEVTMLPPAPSPLAPEAIPLAILYEDTDVLVVSKPAGMAVHPAAGHPAHTLVNAVLGHFPGLAEIGGPRPGIVHRLDKDTSGVMVVAKNAGAQRNLVAQFKARSVAKVYLALVKGRLSPARGTIEAPLGRSPADRKLMAVVARGREARTGYHVQRYIGGYTLLEAMPETGRTHQIRVHLGAIGFPVVGDRVYGVRSPYLSRQFLHAYRLGFKLPGTGQFVEFTAELPDDLARALGDIEKAEASRRA